MAIELRLLLGPAGAGKSRRARAELWKPRRGRAILLQPRSRQRALEPPRSRAHQYLSLARLLLRRAGLTRRLASDTLRRQLLRRELGRLAAAGALPRLGAAATRAGFIALIDELISDLRAADVDPAALATAAVTHYDAEVATIMQAYAAAMTSIGYDDLNGLLARARDALRADPHLLPQVDLLVVDGFDQFSELQLSLLLELIKQAGRTLITLSGATEERAAHYRFIRSRRRLEIALASIGCRPQLEFLPTTSADRAPALARIESQIFELETAPPLPGAAALHLIEAPDREREVRAVLRRVRQLLAADVSAGDIALVMRDDAVYAPLLREVAAEYALPLQIHAGRALAEVPALAAALLLLRLPLEGFPRRGIVESWRAIADWAGPPAAPLAAELPDLTAAAALLDRIGRDNGIVAGLGRLRQAVQLTADADPPADGEWQGSLVTPAAAAALLPLLERFADWLQPPGSATVGQCIAWLTGCLSDCTSWVQMVPTGGAGFAGRLPPGALLAWQRLLAELTRAAEVLDAPPVAYAEFFGGLAAAVASRRYREDSAAEEQCVAALSVLAARGRVFKHLLLLGLSEGEFPRRPPEPPLYSRRERALLAQQGLLIGNEDPGDERSLFYEAVSMARQSLTLSRTRLDSSGNELPASPYLHMLLKLVQPGPDAKQRIMAGAAPTADEAVSGPERLLALFSAGPAAAGADAPPELAALAAHVRRARDIELYREGAAPHGIFEGLINDASLQEELARIYGSDHLWSVSQFNDYITCPYRFKAAHLLRLEVRTEADAGLDRSRRGRLYHAILAAAGRVWAGSQVLLEETGSEQFLAVLREAAAQVLADAPQQQGFEPGPFWNWEQADIQRRLEQALRRVLDEGGDWQAFYPADCERSFGMRRGDPPLRLDTPVGPVQVLGRIDRIDRRKSDNALAVIDYKSNSTPRSLEESLCGRDVQLPIYMLAAERLAGGKQPVERAAFLHLGSGRYSKALTTAEREQAIAAMLQMVAEVVQGARSGNFAVRPRDTCPTGCSFADICRLNLQKRDMLQ